MKKPKKNSDLFNQLTLQQTPESNNPETVREPETAYSANKPNAAIEVMAGGSYHHHIGGDFFAPVRVLRQAGAGYEVQSTISGFKYFADASQICN